jgi:hypothetical protein
MDMMDVPDESEIKNNPYILSHTMSMGKKSFANSKQSYYKLAPPPKYFSNEFLLREFHELLASDKEDLLFGFEYPEQGGLICTDKEMLDK